MKYFRLLYKYLCHFFTAKHTRGHGVHSPFVFNFTTFVLYAPSTFYIFKTIEQQRSRLLKDTCRISVSDFGTGKNRESAIKKEARRSLKSAKYGQLFFRIINYYGFRNVLELGTSFGITTAYMASVSQALRCTSIEACPQTARRARMLFDELSLQNVNLIEGDIDSVLPDELQVAAKYDFVFLDANHRYEALLRYFEQIVPHMKDNSILIVDDLYWSSDMEKAWSVIKEHPQVRATIDLFQIGIVFFNSDLNKKHYKMRY